MTEPLHYSPAWDLSTIPVDVWASEHGKRNAAKRLVRTPGGRIIPRPCRTCGGLFGLRALAKHKRVCKGVAVGEQ